MTVKEFLKSVSIWQSYMENYNGFFPQNGV